MTIFKVSVITECVIDYQIEAGNWEEAREAAWDQANDDTGNSVKHIMKYYPGVQINGFSVEEECDESSIVEEDKNIIRRKVGRAKN